MGIRNSTCTALADSHDSQRKFYCRWLASTNNRGGASLVERVVDNRGGVCQQCDTEYQSLSQHWSLNQSCEYRSLSDHQREIIRGMLLGDGSLDANEHAYLRCGSKRQPHLEWLADELGWLSRGVTRESDDTYRLRTMGHPNLGRYWTWMSGPSTGYSLTPTAARVWHACDGALSFGGSSDVPRIAFAATSDAKRDAIAQLLAQRGFQPQIWDRRVALPRAKTKPWLNWIGDPSPGSEYKWCVDEASYRDARNSGETASQSK